MRKSKTLDVRYKGEATGAAGVPLAFFEACYDGRRATSEILGRKIDVERLCY
jgi:hypothetical protein